ncbi:uncharacterized protein LOC111331161 [Stylophora pistillata]|nr:uncharacterized protein LOC111331161 [Stylophora pistillata]
MADSGTASTASVSYKPGEYFRRYQLTKLVPDSEDNGEDVDSLLGTENSAENVENVQQLSKTKRKASTHEAKAPKKQKVNKKFTWSPRMIEDVLAYMKEYKSSCDFKGLDFEADLSSMYTQIRNSMARHYVDDFGPEKVMESEVELKDMDKDTYLTFAKKTNAEKLLIKSGYSRVKEKIKALRQDYRAAVSKGSRSGSSHVVQENYDLLAEIWGGSPATTSLSFGIDGDSILGLHENDNETDSPRSYDDSLSSADSPHSSATGDSYCTETPMSVPHSSIPKLVDNKRKHMEKKLSQYKGIKY